MITGLGSIVSVLLWASSPLLTGRMFPSYHNPDEIRKAITLLSVLLVPRFWQSWAAAARVGDDALRLPIAD